MQGGWPLPGAHSTTKRPRSVGQDDLSASRLSHLSDAVAESGEAALRLDEGLPAEVTALGVRVPRQQQGWRSASGADEYLV